MVSYPGNEPLGQLVNQMETWFEPYTIANDRCVLGAGTMRCGS